MNLLHMRCDIVVRSLVVSLIITVLGGCGAVRNMMYKTTGDVMVNYAQEHQAPYMLATDDTAMSCGMSEALTPLLMSFGRVRAEPDQLAVMVLASSSICAETDALEEELRYLRAIRSNDPNEAEDALIAQKRFNVLAAKRNYSAYRHLTAHYGEPGGECPTMETDFDRFIWLMGMVAGLQALNNEITSTAGLGIPKNIAAKVERGAACLEDDDWWGLPMAIRATVWSMLPGAEPQGESAAGRLTTAARKGESAGVRLAHVFQALSAHSKGKEEEVKDVIRQHAASKKKKPSDVEHRLLDELSTMMLLAMSDRMWTEHTGHRTPSGGLGTFWDDQKQSNVETVEIDDLL